MRSLKFHLVRAQNLLCFGPKGIEIHFDDLGKIVYIKGVNLDAPSSEGEPASNGAGKSSLPELLSIGLYGKTIKSPTKCKGESIINVLSSKGEVEVQWDDFRILRTYNKSKSGVITSNLQVWESQNRIWDDSADITKRSGKGNTQAYIEEKIGLSHQAFCNVIMFDDCNTYSFLESDTPTKRKIVENLLDLDQYQQYHENTKGILKDLRLKIASMSLEYSHCCDDLQSSEQRITALKQQEANWTKTKKLELNDLVTRLEKKQSKLRDIRDDAELEKWQKAQERIVVLDQEMADIEEKTSKVAEIIQGAKDKLYSMKGERQDLNNSIQEYSIYVRQIVSDINQQTELMDNLQNLKDGTVCSTCYGPIKRSNFGRVLAETRAKINDLQTKKTEQDSTIASKQEALKEKDKSLLTVEQKIADVEKKLNLSNQKMSDKKSEKSQLLKIPKPEASVVKQVLETEILELEKQVTIKKKECDGDSPFKEIFTQAVADKDKKELEKQEKSVELKKLETDLPYYEFWLEAFSDNGIRRFVIEGIIPSLNERISHWLQILIDGVIDLKFDDKLDSTITRRGNAVKYHNMSNGEKRRINLSVSQAFAYVMVLACGNCPSVVFLDEITGGGIDRAGISGIYNMIFELAKERQVFVTTHNENLMSLLQGCETLTLKKQDDITILSS